MFDGVNVLLHRAAVDPHRREGFLHSAAHIEVNHDSVGLRIEVLDKHYSAVVAIISGRKHPGKNAVKAFFRDWPSKHHRAEADGPVSVTGGNVDPDETGFTVGD